MADSTLPRPETVRQFLFATAKAIRVKLALTCPIRDADDAFEIIADNWQAALAAEEKTNSGG